MIRLSLLLAPVCLLACGDDDSFEYAGTPGTMVSVGLSGLVPLVPGSVAGVPGELLVDTGAPFTILDKDSFPGLEQDGARDVDLRAFELDFPAYPVISYDFFGGVDDGLPDGLIGGDLLRHFAFWLDYQDARAGLFLAGDGPTSDATRVEAILRLGFSLEGGGRSLIPGDCPPEPFCGAKDLPPTRILLRARFEGDARLHNVVIDSGASATATNDFFLATLLAEGRPVLSGIELLTAGGPVVASMTRFSRTELVSVAGEELAIVDDMPVLVLPVPGLFDSISREVGVRVDVLIGATFLREYQTGIDYPLQELALARYRSRSHIPVDEWIGPGFTLSPAAGGEWRVGELYGGSDAELEGLVQGEVVVALGGTDITGLPAASVAALLDGHAVGDVIAVTVLRDGSPLVLDISVEDLLPSFPYSEAS